MMSLSLIKAMVIVDPHIVQGVIQLYSRLVRLIQKSYLFNESYSAPFTRTDSLIAALPVFCREASHRGWSVHTVEKGGVIMVTVENESPYSVSDLIDWSRFCIPPAGLTRSLGPSFPDFLYDVCDVTSRRCEIDAYMRLMDSIQDIIRFGMRSQQLSLPLNCRAPYAFKKIVEALGWNVTIKRPV